MGWGASRTEKRAQGLPKAAKNPKTLLDARLYKLKLAENELDAIAIFSEPQSVKKPNSYQ